MSFSGIIAFIIVAVFLAVFHKGVWVFLKSFMPIFMAKLPLALVTIWAVATAVFFMAKAAGGEVEAIIKEGRMDERVIENIREQYGLNDPLWKQYLIQMGKLAQFDTLPSYNQRHRTFRDVLRDHLPVSAALAWRALVLAVFLGIPIGVITALYHNRWPDQVGMVIALLGVSVPNFVIAALAVYFGSSVTQAVQATEWKDPPYLWIPAIALGAFPFAAILRLTRASMLEALREDYVRTARAKGVAEWKVIGIHALRNSLSSVVTYIAIVAAGMLVGSLVVEKIFIIPGLGDTFVTTVQNRDMPLILGITTFFAALMVFANLVADSLYPVLNPRLREA